VLKLHTVNKQRCIEKHFIQNVDFTYYLININTVYTKVKIMCVIIANIEIQLPKTN